MISFVCSSSVQWFGRMRFKKMEGRKNQLENTADDELLALERTFLAYIRTSVILAMQGVLIAQLFRLQSPHSSEGLGFHRVGVPLSVTCHCAALVTAVLGAHRFWKQQSAIALGTIYSGGWEMNCIGFLTTAVSFIN